MTYLARPPLLRLLRIALIPVLLLSLLAANSQSFYSSGQEHSNYDIERHEHKTIHPVRIHTMQLKFLPNLRVNDPGIIPALPPEASAAVLVVSLYPIIYMIKKRLLLYPLKYTSQYVGICLLGHTGTTK